MIVQLKYDNFDYDAESILREKLENISHEFEGSGFCLETQTRDIGIKVKNKKIANIVAKTMKQVFKGYNPVIKIR